MLEILRSTSQINSLTPTFGGKQNSAETPNLRKESLRQNLPVIHGGMGQDVHRLNMQIVRVFLLSASLTTTLSFAQSATPTPASTNQTPLTLATIHQQVNDKAVLLRAGDPQAIADISHIIFSRVGIPVEVADSFHFSQPSTTGTTYVGVYNGSNKLVGVSEFTYTFNIVNVLPPQPNPF